MSPVMLPPGRASPATSPVATRSGATMVTMGMVVVARQAASISRGPVTTMTSTFCCTSSAANAFTRSAWPPAKRRSTTMFRPSTYPCSHKRSKKAIHCGGSGPAGSVPIESSPMRGILAGDWACAATWVHTTSTTAPATATRRPPRLIARRPRR